MKLQAYTPNPALVAFLGLAPLVGATANFASASVIGLLMAVGALVAAGASALARHYIRGRLAAAAQLTFIALYATLCWILVEAWSPPLAADIGIYLPLLAVSSLVTHEIRKTGSSSGISSALQYVALALLVGVIREIGGVGTLSLPLPGYAIQTIPIFAQGPLPILRSPAGGFFVLAFLALVDRIVTLRLRGKEAIR